jgi:hypothetical protein
MMLKRILGACFGASLALSAAAANATVVFSDNFDDGDVTDWVKSTNYGGSTFVETDGVAVSGQSLFTYLTAPPGGVNLVVWATKSFNAPVAGDYLLSLYAVSTVCSGCVVSYDIFVDSGATHTSRTNHTAGFQLVEISLNGLAAGSHELTLGVHTTNASSGLFGARFDNVEVSTQAEVAEAPAVAILAGGLAAIGATAMRRRKT